MLGSEYIIPPLPGSLIISNHKLDSTQIDIQGASFSIPANGMYKLDWPIPGTNGVTKILSQSDISIKWTEDENSK